MGVSANTEAGGRVAVGMDVRVSVAVGKGRGEGLGVAVSMGEAAGVCVGEGAGVALAAGSGVLIGASLGAGVRVTVGGRDVWVGSRVAVAVKVGCTGLPHAVSASPATRIMQPGLKRCFIRRKHLLEQGDSSFPNNALE